jgi:hypothetical protein
VSPLYPINLVSPLGGWRSEGHGTAAFRANETFGAAFYLQVIGVAAPLAAPASRPARTRPARPTIGDMPARRATGRAVGMIGRGASWRAAEPRNPTGGGNHRGRGCGRQPTCASARRTPVGPAAWAAFRAAGGAAPSRSARSRASGAAAAPASASESKAWEVLLSMVQEDISAAGTECPTPQGRTSQMSSRSYSPTILTRTRLRRLPSNSP